MQGSRNCEILQSRIGEHGVSLENMEKEMFSGSPTEMLESSPTQTFSGFPTEVFSPMASKKYFLKYNVRNASFAFTSLFKTVLDKGGANSDQ